MKTTFSRFGMFALIWSVFAFQPRVLRAQDQGEGDNMPRVEDQDNGENPAADDVVVQARGPVHEAYAEPVEASRQPGLIVPKKPPEPVPEQPPDEKLQGDNVQWIPGYWAWEADRTNFIWVSGFWRIPPAGRKWVPGYWTQVEDGWQWIPGFWAADDQDQVQYLEEPPESLDYGPDTPAPDDNSTYVPGCWQYRETRYVWRPGYWMTAQPGYVWTPDHYCYTPSGYVFVNGYWDYPLLSRGLLFCPVAFNRPLWTNPNWYWQPRDCVNFSGLLPALFVHSSYSHYFFGDYYGRSYSRRGFTPWLAYGRRYHDPLYSYYSWRHRDNPGWYRGLRDTYLGRLDGRLPRPAHTLVQQRRLIQNIRNNVNIRRNITNINSYQVVKPFTQINHVRLTRLDRTQINRVRNVASSFRQVSLNRQRLERPGRSLVGRSARLNLGNIPRGGRPTSLAHTSRPVPPLPRPQRPNHGGNTAPHSGRPVPAAQHTFPQRPNRYGPTGRPTDRPASAQHTFPQRPYRSSATDRTTRPYRSAPSGARNYARPDQRAPRSSSTYRGERTSPSRSPSFREPSPSRSSRYGSLTPRRATDTTRPYSPSRATTPRLNSRPSYSPRPASRNSGRFGPNRTARPNSVYGSSSRNPARASSNPRPSYRPAPAVRSNPRPAAQPSYRRAPAPRSSSRPAAQPSYRPAPAARPSPRPAPAARSSPRPAPSSRPAPARPNRSSSPVRRSNRKP